jgi:hypothetical protein
MLQLRTAKAYDTPSLSPNLTPKPNLAQIHAPCKCETDSILKTESVWLDAGPQV